MTAQELLTMKVDDNSTLREVLALAERESLLDDVGEYADGTTVLCAAERILESLRAAGVTI